jgi:hypothetical protein
MIIRLYDNLEWFSFLYIPDQSVLNRHTTSHRATTRPETAKSLSLFHARLLPSSHLFRFVCRCLLLPLVSFFHIWFVVWNFLQQQNKWLLFLGLLDLFTRFPFSFSCINLIHIVCCFSFVCFLYFDGNSIIIMCGRLAGWFNQFMMVHTLKLGACSPIVILFPWLESRTWRSLLFFSCISSFCLLPLFSRSLQQWLTRIVVHWDILISFAFIS